MSDKKELRFLHINTRITPDIQNAMEEHPRRSGMYNWMFLFKGEMKPYQFVEDDEWAKFDVVQVNMSPVDMHLVPKIRRKLDKFAPNTMLVLNNDYVCETWDNAFQMPPDYYDEVQRNADMLFSTEPHQVSNMLEGAFVIPHPTDTKRLKKIAAPEKSNSVGTIFHWWSGDSYIPSRTANLMKKKFGFDSTRLYGYHMPEKDRMQRWNKVMWDEKIGGMNFPEYAQHIAGNALIYEPCNYHTYGRNTVETACLRVPVVGSDRIYSMKKLYPFTSCDPYDAKKTLEIAEKLMTDKEFRKKVIDYAYEHVDEFGYEASKKRFLDALEVCRKRGGHKFYKEQGD